MRPRRRSPRAESCGSSRSLARPMAAILTLTAVSKSFGALRVTDGISFAVAEGETLGILGPNGAGKTTLFNLVSGQLRPDAGRIAFRGRDIVRDPPHRRCRMGMGRAYQIPKPFGAMTLFENLVTAAALGGQRRGKGTHHPAGESPPGPTL